jgi:tetratricopeptide (TPR) repeat protein
MHNGLVITYYLWIVNSLPCSIAMKTFLAIVLVTQVVKAQEDRLRSIVKEGIDLHDKQDYRGALSKYCQALLLDRESPLVHYEIACSYSAMKMYDSAIWHSDKVIASTNEALALQAMILKGAAIDDKGNPQEAVDYYQHVLIKYPEHYLLLYNYAVSCARLGLTDESEDALTKALRNRISHPSSNLKLAYLKAGKGEKVSAIFGLYFFLLLENNTERSAEALEALFAALYAQSRRSTLLQRMTWETKMLGSTWS